jgi:chemotaxis response regulator CheB
VVWGMPGSAVEMGGVVEILPLDQIGAAASRWVQSRVA